MPKKKSEAARAAPPPEKAASEAPADVQSAEPQKAKPRRRWLRPALLLIGPLLVAIIGGCFYLLGGRYVSTENAYVKADKVMIAAEVSGLISEVDVDENQHVKKGDVLFRIDDRTYRIALTEAEAHLANVHDEIAGLKASYRQKQEEIKLARSNVSFAQTQYDRYAKLLSTNTTSQSRFDTVAHDLDVAKQNIRVTEQAMAQIRAELGGDLSVPLEQAARYREARAARQRAELDLERTTVRAPFAGIASNTPEQGHQVIGNGALSSPVMSIVADRNVWIEANYKETDLTHVRPGQPVTIHVDTYDGRDWHGTVQSIAQATGAEFSVIPPQNATGNWVKVVQRIPVRIAVETGDDGPALRAGMSTSVEIDTGHRRAMPGFLQTALSWLGRSAPAPAAYAKEQP